MHIKNREDIFLTSKLWCTEHHPDRVRAALMITLRNLDTPYIDLYLIHVPMALEPTTDGAVVFPTDTNGQLICADHLDYVHTWRELERAVDDKLVRSIGISNFNRAQCERLLANCRTRPVTNQVECHPYLTQQKLGAYLRSEGILLTAYSPLGSPDRPWAKVGDAVLLEEATLVSIAEKYRKSTAQLLIRYQTQRGHLVVPKSVTPSRIHANFNVFDFQLSEEDMRAIDAFERNGRLVPMERYI